MSKRKRKPPQPMYTNKNSTSLVLKCKTLRNELSIEKQRSKLRLQLLRKLLKSETITPYMLEAIIRYVESDGDETKQAFVDVPPGDIMPSFLVGGLRDENIYSTFVHSRTR